jgi:uncharacterized protein
MAISVHVNIIKTFVIWLAVLGFLSYAGWQAYLYITNLQQPRTQLTVSGSTFNVRIVSSDPDRQKGLAGVKELASNEGMLFVFDHDEKWGMWMKDMQIPIDMVWLDNEQRIIYIVKKADPSSYPFTTYKPTRPARYVIELAAGTAERKSLKIGDRATFDLSGIGQGSGS